jgi:hypothetical protein
MVVLRAGVRRTLTIVAAETPAGHDRPYNPGDRHR